MVPISVPQGAIGHGESVFLTVHGINGVSVAGEIGAAHGESVDADNLRVQKPSCHGNAVTV
jgi:hypothetical protein